MEAKQAREQNTTNNHQTKRGVSLWTHWTTTRIQQLLGIMVVLVVVVDHCQKASQFF
jgi:hypothetical protein